MDWKLIFKFVFYLFVLTAAAAFPFGFIHGFFYKELQYPPMWVSLSQGLMVLLVLLLVFIRIGFVAHLKALQYSLIIGAITWLISLPINVMIFHSSTPSQWASHGITMLIILTIGSLIGKTIYSWRSKKTTKPSD